MFRAIAHRWSALALTTRLTAIFTFTLVVALSIGGFTTLTALRTYFLQQVDTQLNTAVRLLAPVAYDSIDNCQTDKRIPSDYYVRIYIMGKKACSIITNATVARNGMPRDEFLPTHRDIPAISATRSLVLISGQTVPSTRPNQSWRLVSITLTNDKKPVGAVTVGVSMTGEEETIQAVSFTVFISTLIIAIVGTLLSNYLIARAFRPLNQIEMVAGKIAGGDLSQRIPPAPKNTEVGSLANSLNTMLSQIEAAFSAQEKSEQKMRRFVSDASHELRTPTAAIRGYAELSRMGGVSEEQRAEVMGRIESEATRMGNLVQDLLTLARLDEQRPLHPRDTDITELAAGALSDLFVLDATRDTALLNLAPIDNEYEVFPVHAIVDGEKISQVLTNLLSNVLQHTPGGTPVEIAVGYHTWPEPSRVVSPRQVSTMRAADLCAVFEVRDHGPGVSDEAAEKVFQRFYRADASRARTSGGTGLGLAIVSGVVSSHCGVVRMLHTPGGGATVQVKLPCQYLPREDGPKNGTAGGKNTI